MDGILPRTRILYKVTIITKMLAFVKKRLIMTTVIYKFRKIMDKTPSAYPIFCIAVYFSFRKIIEYKNTNTIPPAEIIGNITEEGSRESR